VIPWLTVTPQTKRQLAEKAGITQREVELLIQQARLEGAPICSNADGYWLGTAAEVEECARRLRSRYIHQAITARALRRTARRLREPMTLWAL
jgi:biotin operon repressor